MTRVAVASRSFSHHPQLRAELLAHYPDVTFNDAGERLSGQGLVDFLRGHEKAITALERLDGTVFKSLPELKVVSKYGVGLDMIDLAAMQQWGVALGWTGGVNKRSVSELAMTLMISLLRRLPETAAALRSGAWQQIRGRQLTERTVGILGCGHIGKDLGRLLRNMGCRVLAHDLLDFPAYYAETGIEPVGLEELLRESDIVTLHLPLDESTRNILDAERLDFMRPNALLINTARGGLVDEAPLKAMLQAGRLGGAAFDVFAVEPPADRDWLTMNNVIVTPHIGGSSEEAVLAMGRAAIDGLDHFGDPFIVAGISHS